MRVETQTCRLCAQRATAPASESSADVRFLLPTDPDTFIYNVWMHVDADLAHLRNQPSSDE